MHHLACAEELVACLGGVDEEMLYAVVCLVGYRVAPDSLTDTQEERTHTCILQQLFRLHSANNTCKTTGLSIYTLNREREREIFYLTMHSTHFIYGYMASDIWLRTIRTVRKETCCRHIGYSYRLTARVLLYASSHRQDNTYHGLCYTSRGALAGTRNSSMDPKQRPSS